MTHWERICLPIQETQVQSLVQEDPQRKEMAPHSTILTWKTQWTEEPDRQPSPYGRKGLDTTEQINNNNNYNSKKFCAT